LAGFTNLDVVGIRRSARRHTSRARWYGSDSHLQFTNWTVTKQLELCPAAGPVVRLLGYANHANMGSHDEAIAALPSSRCCVSAWIFESALAPNTCVNRSAGPGQSCALAAIGVSSVPA
jgi:hypothetical protein